MVDAFQASAIEKVNDAKLKYLVKISNLSGDLI